MENLRTLSLSGNMIRSLPPKAFSPLKMLEKLDLSHNDLAPELIHPNVFDSNGISFHLRSLDLSHNHLTFVPEKPFSKLKNLTSLNLGFNSIGKSGSLSNDASDDESLEGILRNNSFVDLSSLTDLNLESNQLETLESHAFNGLQDSLENLDLSSNHLEVVPSSALSLLTRLSSITLSRNRIVVLNNNCLQGVSNLRSFTLKNDDNLKGVEVDAFASNPLLEKVSIEFCPNFKQVHEETFLLQRESSLKQVSLRANGLAILPRHLLSWTFLKSLDIRGNPFDCRDGCFIDWLSRLISRNNSNLIAKNIIPEEFPREILCHDPLQLRGHEVASLTEEELSHTNRDSCSSNNQDIESTYITQNDNDLDVQNRRQLSIVTGTAKESSSTLSWMMIFAIISALLSACVFSFLFMTWRRKRREFLTELRLKEYFSNNSGQQLVSQYHYHPSSPSHLSSDTSVMRSHLNYNPMVGSQQVEHMYATVDDIGPYSSRSKVGGGMTAKSGELLTEEEDESIESWNHHVMFGSNNLAVHSYGSSGTTSRDDHTSPSNGSNITTSSTASSSCLTPRRSTTGGVSSMHPYQDTLFHSSRGLSNSHATNGRIPSSFNNRSNGRVFNPQKLPSQSSAYPSPPSSMLVIQHPIKINSSLYQV